MRWTAIDDRAVADDGRQHRTTIDDGVASDFYVIVVITTARREKETRTQRHKERERERERERRRNLTLIMYPLYSLPSPRLCILGVE